MTTITIEKAIVHRALSALEYHTQQTRPIHNTELVIEELRTALSAPATAPATAPEQRINELEAEIERLRKDAERKPMTSDEVFTAWTSTSKAASQISFTAGVRAAEAFHGIKGTP